MFKVTDGGIIELGKPIELTEDDQIEILKNFVDVSRPPAWVKRNGKWIQPTLPKEYLEG